MHTIFVSHANIVAAIVSNNLKQLEVTKGLVQALNTWSLFNICNSKILVVILSVEFHIIHFFCSFLLLLIQLKCKKYWPNEGECYYGNICVSQRMEQRYTDYTIRTFSCKRVGINYIP